MIFDRSPGDLPQLPEAMNKLMAALSIVGMLIMGPFAVNHLYAGRYLLAFGSFVLVLIFAYNALSIYHYNRHHPNLMLLGLVPAILFLLILAVQKQGVIGMYGVYWSYPAVISFYFMIPERKAWIANIALLAIILPFAWISFDHALAIRVSATLIMVSIFSAIFVRIISGQQRALQQLAVTDPLTGVLNRTLLNDALNEAIQQSGRSRVPMTLAILDLDHFKKINDVHGHDVGDNVLSEVAALLKKRCRSVDKIFRLGGEEFLLLLYATDIDDARLLAEEIRASISSLAAIPGCPISTSVGIAGVMPGELRQDWMKRADKNLYHAKSNGRNRVEG